MVLESLIKSGIDVNTCNANKQDGTMLCQAKSEPEIVKLLIDAGADVNVFDRQNITPLHYNYSPEAVKLLLKAGADIHAKERHGRIPLYTTLNPEIIEMLLEKEPDKSKVLDYYKTPLHKATDPEKISKMLEMGADVNQKDGQGKTPLHTVKNPECAKMLIEAGADVNATDNKGRTPLDSAKNDEIKEIISNAGGIRKNNEDEIVMPKELDEAKVEELKKSFIKSGIDVNERDLKGKTRLFNTEDINEVKALIELGADVNAKDRAGFTPLHQASVEKSKLLLEAGADPNALDIYCFGDSPLTFAFQNSDLAKAKLLLENGADPHLFRGHHGDTHIKTTTLKMLMDAGININQVREDYWNRSLFQAVIDKFYGGDIELLKTLIKAGADLLTEYQSPTPDGFDIKNPMNNEYVQEALRQIEAEKAVE